MKLVCLSITESIVVHGNDVIQVRIVILRDSGRRVKLRAARHTHKCDRTQLLEVCLGKSIGESMFKASVKAYKASQTDKLCIWQSHWASLFISCLKSYL